MLQAVAALLQKDTSAIVTLKSSGIDRPSKLDGKQYASYGARYQGFILCACKGRHVQHAANHKNNRHEKLVDVAASYQTGYTGSKSDAHRYEGRIVQQMIISDGGEGNYTEDTPPTLGIWETVLAVGSNSLLCGPCSCTLEDLLCYC